MNTESIRSLILNNPRTVDGYTQKVRDAVGRYAEARRAEGARWNTLEVELGVSSASMRLWMRALSSARFHQVVVVDPIDEAPEDFAEVESELVITTPSGFTLTGCTLEQAADLLQRLQ